MEDLEISEKITVEDPIIIWKACLLKIKESVSMMTYNTWFLPIKPVEIKNSTLKVQIPSQFFWEWIDEHFNVLITKSITEILGDDAKLTYVIAEDLSFVESNDVHIEKTSNQNSLAEKSKPKHSFESNLNPRYTFDNFIKGTSFNPLFLYGGVGLGKTHLMQAIGNQIVKNFPDKKVIYLSSDIFTVEFVESIQTNKVNEFSNFYRSMDVLIIDDIQFLIGKEKTQDLFFHIFNTLHQSRKQIILSSDKPPKDLKGLDERLISRFQWGLTADIQPPELETRIAILKRKAETYGMLVSNEILEYIATNITSNIRELEGCLIKLLASVSLSSKEITFELAKKTVKEIATDRKTSTLTIETITKVVCEHLGVAENKIRDKTRKKEIVLARQIAMYLAKDLTLSSLKTIGLHFGGRDHSTVIHACNSIEDYRGRDSSFQLIIDDIRNKVELAG